MYFWLADEIQILKNYLCKHTKIWVIFITY